MTNHPYDLSYLRPAVVLPNREEQFTCEECGRQGWGPPSSRVHQGRCRLLHSRKIAKRTAERNRRKKAAARAALAVA